MDQKYQIGNEYGTIVWDISRILRDKERFQVRDFSVADLADYNPFHGDVQYAMKTDLSRPLIVVKLSNEADKVIDGNHRLFHCVMEHIPLVKAYYLDIKEHWQYIIDFDEDVYWDVVNHWKKKDAAFDLAASFLYPYYSIYFEKLQGLYFFLEKL